MTRKGTGIKGVVLETRRGFDKDRQPVVRRFFKVRIRFAGRVYGTVFSIDSLGDREAWQRAVRWREKAVRALADLRTELAPLHEAARQRLIRRPWELADEIRRINRAVARRRATL